MWEEAGYVEKVQKPSVLCTILRPMLQSEVELNSRMISGGLCLKHFGVEVGFPARDWDGSQEWEHQILVTRPVVSDKGPGPSALQKRIPTKMESGKTNKVFIKRKKNTVHVDRNIGGLGERVSHWITPFWWFEFLLWGISSGFPLANLDLPGSQSIFGISQDPPIWVYTSLSQDGFCQKGIWVEYPLT